MLIDRRHQLFEFESELWEGGKNYIAGIDEVGRGPIAGPVVAAAVIIPKYSQFPLVNDSKKLTERQRKGLFKEITEYKGLQYAIAEISVENIDRLNILKASQLAMIKAVNALKDVEYALIDGLQVSGFPIDNRAIVKGDSKSASIAASSIIAKVHRDKLMMELAKKYPDYGFDRHKGYCTKDHLRALDKFGPCPFHRKSFAPVKDFYCDNEMIQQQLSI